MRQILIALLCLTLAGCAYGGDSEIGGRIVVWHEDDPGTSATLDSLAQRFMEINPEIQVSLVAIPQEDMLMRYTNAAELSLGPDLFIGDSTWIMQIADAGLIKSIDRYEPVIDQYLSAAIENVTYDGNIYGIPYELSPNALYYNADMVTTPAQTLTELLDQAANGMGTAMTTRFDRAFWGVSNFGGSPFDEEGRVSLDRGGFASWLTWMTTAQNSAGMFLNNDQATLINLFTSENVAYYVGTPDDLPLLRESMDEDIPIRVTSLPAGPGGSAGPLLHLDTFMFNSASAERNTRAALALARFLTNEENSLRLAREIGHVPANLRVRGIDARTYPIINAFMTQARTALPIPNTDAMTAMRQDGNRLYRQVLDGAMDPTLAARQFTETINTLLGFDAPAQDVVQCTQRGEIRLWHSWQDDDEAVLSQIIEDYEAFCTGVEVTLTQFRTENELVLTYRILYDMEIRPDAIILSDRWLYDLSSETLIQPVSGDFLQQFVPRSLDALTYQNQIFGVPLALNMTVMFYNTDLVTDLPRTLDDLLSEAAESRTVALATDFESAFWGISAFGGGLFDADMTPSINQNDAMVAWLEWLLDASTLPGIILDEQAGADAFAAGEAAYFIGSSALIPRFVESLGNEIVAIAELPAGQVGDSSPILDVSALMLNVGLESNQLPVVQSFVDYVTSVDNQTQILVDAGRIPVNVNVDTTGNDLLIVQTSRVTVLPNAPQTQPLLTLGNVSYRDVLSGETTPADAVTTLITQVDMQNVPTATPPTQDTTNE